MFVILVELEVRRPVSEAAGAGEAGVAEDAAGALPGVQLEPDHQLLLSCQRRLLQTFILCSGELEADINVPCAGLAKMYSERCRNHQLLQCV